MRVLGTHAGFVVDLHLGVHTLEVAARADRTRMHGAGADFGLAIAGAYGHTPTRRDALIAVAVFRFVVHHNVIRVEVLILARYSRAEKQRAQGVVDVVIDATAHRCGLDNDFITETVARFNRDFLTVGQNIGAGETIVTRGAIGAQLIFHKRLRGLGAKRADGHILPAEFGLDPIHRARVA